MSKSREFNHRQLFCDNFIFISSQNHLERRFASQKIEKKSRKEYEMTHSVLICEFI